jgi:hypothetical protein
MGVYIHTDTTRLTFAELWRMHRRLPVFLLACRNKIFGIRPPTRHAIYHEETVVTVPAEEIAPPAWRALRPRAEAFEQLGAELVFYHTVRSTPNVMGYAATLLPPERNAVIVVTWSRARIGKGPGTEDGSCVVLSQLEDGRFLNTTDRVARFNPPPLFVVQRCRGATAEELLDRHQEALAAAAVPAVPVADTEHAKQVLVDGKRANFAWHISRGVWVPLTREELAALGLTADDEE